jgi:rhodanese-related sulfurtransferase
MVETITAGELADLLSNQRVGLVDLIDVRDAHEWAAGHIAGTRSVPLEQLREDPAAVLLADATTIFICAKGVRSLAAAKLAERFGYTKVYNLEGGTKTWTALGLRLETSERVAA